MKIPTVRRILLEDLPGDLPDWMEPFVGTLNGFIDTVVQGLRNNLTFEDNFSARRITVTLQSNVELDYNPQNMRRVRGLIPVDMGGGFLTGFGFTRKDNGVIAIRAGFSTTGNFNSTLYMLFEA